MCFAKPFMPLAIDANYYMENLLDWDILIETLNMDKGVLILGPDILTNPNTGQSLSEMLVAHLDPPNNKSIEQYYPDDELFQFTQSSERMMTAFQVRSFHGKLASTNWVEDLFDVIAKIPFSLILTLVEDQGLVDAFERLGLDYYYEDYTPNRGTTRTTVTPTKARPLIYNLLGSSKNEEDLLLTHSDEYTFVENLLGRSPLSDLLRNVLLDSNSILALGIRPQHWLTHIILRNLGLHYTERYRFLKYAVLDDVDDRSKHFLSDQYHFEILETTLHPFLLQLKEKFEEAGLERSPRSSIDDIGGQIISMLAKGEGLDTIIEFTNQVKGDLPEDEADELLLLNNRYQRLKRRLINGILSSDDRVIEENKIRVQILSIAQAIQDTQVRQQKSSAMSDIDRIRERNRQLEDQLKQYELEKEKKEEQSRLEASSVRRKRQANIEEKGTIVDLHEDPPQTSDAIRVAKLSDLAKFEEESSAEEAIALYEKVIDITAYYLPAWQGLERIYRKKNQEGKRQQAAEQVLLIQNVLDFERNARSQIILQSLHLEAIANYKNISWKFNPKMNILLGRNGFGKSHLMRFLIAIVQGDEDISSLYFRKSSASPSASIEVSRNGEQSKIIRNKSMFQEKLGRVPILAIPDLRFVDRNQTTIGSGDQAMSNFRENGALHFLQQIPYEKFVQSFLYELCIEYLDANKTFDLEIFRLIENVVQDLTDNEFKFHRIEAIGNAEFRMEVITEGNPDPLPIQYASQGTLSVCSIFGLIFNYLKVLDPTNDKIKTDEIRFGNGIVIIDEIDAHLHPAWQKKIIGLLRQYFPNVQFIITAHSPLVVVGSLEEEVAALKKATDNSGFYIEKYQKDFIGEEVNDILRGVFQIQDIDETLIRYQSLVPKREEMKERIKELSNKDIISVKEKEELNRLLTDYYYLLKLVQEDSATFEAMIDDTP